MNKNVNKLLAAAILTLTTQSAFAVNIRCVELMPKAGKAAATISGVLNDDTRTGIVKELAFENFDFGGMKFAFAKNSGAEHGTNYAEQFAGDNGVLTISTLKDGQYRYAASFFVSKNMGAQAAFVTVNQINTSYRDLGVGPDDTNFTIGQKVRNAGFDQDANKSGFFSRRANHQGVDLVCVNW